MGERFLDTEEVGGSIPPVPIRYPYEQPIFRTETHDALGLSLLGTEEIMNSQLTITIDGESRDVAAGTSVADLLNAAARGMRVAVFPATEAIYRERINALDARLGGGGV